jgi:flagellar basal-body rod protein FlgB
MVLFSPLMAFTEKMLDVTTTRHKVISDNIANINTPGFKGAEVSFADALDRIQQTARDEGPDLNEEMKTKDINEQLLQNLNLDQLYLEGQRYETDLGVGYSLASTRFEQMFENAEAAGVSIDPRDRPEKALSRADQIAAVQPKIEEIKGTPRQDGNNVSPEMEMGKMIKNTSFYNVLVSSISGEFRTLKTIISNR